MAPQMTLKGLPNKKWIKKFAFIFYFKKVLFWSKKVKKTTVDSRRPGWVNHVDVPSMDGSQLKPGGI